MCGSETPEVDLEEVLKYAEGLGAQYVDLRYNVQRVETIVFENGNLREFSSSVRKGLGIRVIVEGYQGYSSTSRLNMGSVKEAVNKAVDLAKALKGKGEEVVLSDVPTIKDRVVAPYKVDPLSVDPKEKLELLSHLNKVGLEAKDVKSSMTRMGIQSDYRVFVSSSGSRVETLVNLVGMGQVSVAGEAGRLERVVDGRSRVAGYEFIKSYDWETLVREVSGLASKAFKAGLPPAGTYTAVITPEVVGLLLHEAFGHASEGDLVEAGSSVLAGRVGEVVASEYVTIVDEGVVEGGYFTPYDDEGVRKGRTVVVEEGILRSFLTSRHVAGKLGIEATGNGRVQDYASVPIVRQTNYYMLPGDYSVEELIGGVEEGIYVTGKGVIGGEVDPGAGTFTFSVGVSWLIRNGEKKEMVRGVTLSGLILDVLKSIDAVGKELEVRTSVFGGCGKNGQTVKVGMGGPHVRVRKITVGGR
ncbi:MAG: TldD/PmbA family protein [Desulfurococcales archaeon]|nr:TldD/PmbA family protein [Desulfurococcales archaeon]